MTELTISTVERFSKKFTIEDNGCWLWNAHTNNDGYGRFNIKGKIKFAHRVSYIFVNGNIKKNMELDHLCKTRNCVNPNHLEEVTHKENVRRGDGNPGFALYNSSKTRCPQGHEYNLKNTRYEFSKTSRSRLCRKCRECDRLRQLKIREEKRNAS